MKVIHLQNEDDVAKIAPVMLELRPQYNPDQLISQIQSQLQHDYQIVDVERDDGQVLCVAGFTIRQSLARGKHIYLEDLVTASVHRSLGSGSGNDGVAQTTCKGSGM